MFWCFFFFFSSRRRHTRCSRDWSSDVCSSDLKPGGFVQGAGHGNTFQDVYGNWWSTGTPWIAVNWNFERRIGLHPAGFDADGQMYVDTRFGDFPHWLPTKSGQSSDELFTGWMLLSYRKPVTASSMRDSF